MKKKEIKLKKIEKKRGGKTEKKIKRKNNAAGRGSGGL